MFDLDQMTPREQEIAKYWKKKGMEHSTPSPDTINKFANMGDKLDSLTGAVSEIKTSVALITSKFEDDGIVSEIRREVKSTNGKVAAQECEISKLNQWRSYLTGAFAVLGVIVVAILIPLTLSYVKSRINDKGLTEADVKEIIDNNYLKK